MNIKVVGGEMSRNEQMDYVRIVQGKHPEQRLKDVTLTIQKDGNGDEFVDVDYTYDTVPFDRIRRITGYLVGNMDRWNNGKLAEEHDRVKHSLSVESPSLGD